MVASLSAPLHNSLKFPGSASSWFGKLAGFLILVSLAFFSMTAHAADCEPGERGTFNPSDGTFARDTAGQDYRVRCTGDQTDGVNFFDLDHENADAEPDPLRYFVIDIDAANDQSRISLNFDGDVPHDAGVNEAEVFAITGDIRDSADDTPVVSSCGPMTEGTATPIHTLRVESWANLETHGQGSRAVGLYDESGDNVGRIVFVNRGSILTTGDHFIRPADQDVPQPQVGRGACRYLWR